MLMVWIVLNGIGIGLGVISLFRPIFTGLDYSLIGSLISIGLGIWAELIAIGARLEVNSDEMRKPTEFCRFFKCL